MADPLAARELIDATLAIAAAGKPLMARLLPDGQESFVEWEHYPPDDAVDLRSSCRYFYHAHAEGERAADEHGHFHLFFERTGPLAPVQPLAAPGSRGSGHADVVHLVGIVIDRSGLPVRMFTANRWVTDETMLPAEALIAQLPSFDLSNADGDPLVARWLSALVAFYHAPIARLLQERDLQLSDFSSDSFEDRHREILGSIEIDINDALGHPTSP